MAPKGCWTCKDRKVSCDRTVPKCIKCTKSKRACGGYGLRLTWPQGDHSRAVVGRVQPRQPSSYWRNAGWVNVVPTDVRLHFAASSSNATVKELARDQLAFLNIPELIQATNKDVAGNDMDLLHYFECVVVPLLPMLYTDRTKLCHLLIRTALSNRSRSSRSVYHAILALASYHRGGDLDYVGESKRNALRGLRTESMPSECDGLEHIAANLLLAVLEMQRTPINHSCWLGFIIGIDSVINAVKKADPVAGSDASVILGWVYQFDISARFSLRHWRTESAKSVATALGFDANGDTSCHLQYLLAKKSFARGIPNISNHAHPIIRLLAEISETAMHSSDPRYLTPEYQAYLDDLRSRLEKVSPRITGVNESIQEPLSDTEQVLDLTRLAGLIYHERVSRNFSGQSVVIDSWARRALSIIADLDICYCPFALFIISCETDKDVDRLIILDIYARMESRQHLQSTMEIRSLIQTAWNLQDLAEDGKLEYIQKLNIVLSSREVVPSLV